MTQESADRLRDAVRAMRRQGAVTGPVDLAPKSVHEAITRQMVDDLGKDFAKLEGEMRGRVNALMFTVVGAVVLDAVLGLLN